ncbi:MAG: hypothetical protein ACAH59_06085 [Pseudobdellovibrionaceae bacterium]
MFRIFHRIIARLKEVRRKYGWKAVVGIIVYYLIRDLTLYVFLPFYLLKS